MVMVQKPHSESRRLCNLKVKLIFEEAINFQKALIKRDQNILRNKMDDFQVNTNYCD